MVQWAHLAGCSHDCANLADIVFVVGDVRMPAHSQRLAATSKVISALLRDSHTFSAKQPLVLEQQLQTFSVDELQTFLNHIYLDADLDSPAAAEALVRIADFYDATTLLEKADVFLSEVTGSILFARPSDVLHWILLTDRHELPLLLNKCASQAAMCYRDLCTDARFDELGVHSLKKILQGVQVLTELYPGLASSSLPGSHYDGYDYFTPTQDLYAECGTTKLNSAQVCEFLPKYWSRRSGCGANRKHFQGAVIHHVGGPAAQVTQAYMCKTTSVRMYFPCTVAAHLCPGHCGSWSWHIQRHVWQLDSNPAITTKNLPETVVELAQLIGSPPCCQDEVTSKFGASW